MPASSSSGLSALSDEFGDAAATQASWRLFQGDLQDGVPPHYDVIPGRSWWFGGTRAFFLYKLGARRFQGDDARRRDWQADLAPHWELVALGNPRPRSHRRSHTGELGLVPQRRRQR